MNKINIGNKSLLYALPIITALFATTYYFSATGFVEHFNVIAGYSNWHFFLSRNFGDTKLINSFAAILGFFLYIPLFESFFKDSFADSIQIASFILEFLGIALIVGESFTKLKKYRPIFLTLVFIESFPKTMIRIHDYLNKNKLYRKRWIKVILFLYLYYYIIMLPAFSEMNNLQLLNGGFYILCLIFTSFIFFLAPIFREKPLLVTGLTSLIVGIHFEFYQLLTLLLS